MTRDAAGHVLEAWGEPRPFRRGSDPNDGWLVQRSSTTLYVYCDDDGLVEAVELASPGHGVLGDDQVVFEDIDLFCDSADAVVRKLGDRGYHVVDQDNGHTSTVPSVLLGLWRDGEPYDDSRDLPRYFESALIGHPDRDG